METVTAGTLKCMSNFLC